MIKYIQFLVVILMLLNSFDIVAQHRRSLWINGITGVNGSLTINQNAYGNPEMAYAPTVGLTGGMGMSYFYDKKTAFNGSILYTKLGQNYSGVQAGGHAKRGIKLAYLEVPLMVMKQITVMRFPAWIALGPDVMVLLNANQLYSREGGNALQNPEWMASGIITDRFKRVDFAINASVSQFVDLKWYRKTILLLTLNTAIGLTDINSYEWQIPNSHGVYGRSYNFYMGFKVGLMFEAMRFGVAGW